MGKKLSKRDIKNLNKGNKKINFKKIVPIGAAICVFVILLVVIIFKAKVPDRETFLTINGRSFTQTEYAVHYSYMVNNYLAVYDDHVDYLGLDLTRPFDEQIYDEETGQTWFSYFCELTNASLQTTETLYNASVENGYKPVGTIYNDFITSVKMQAKEANRSYLNFLQTMFIDTLTVEIFEEQMYRYCTAVEYSEYLKNTYKTSVTDEEIEKYYNGNSEFYDTVDYHIFAIPYDKDLEEDNENISLTRDSARLRAENVAKAKSVSEFQTLSIESAIDETKEDYKIEDATKTYIVGIGSDASHSAAAKWLFNKERVSGDTGIFEENGRYFVLYFDNRYRNDNSTVTFRHIYISTETYGDENTLADAAVALYQYWYQNGATEEMFAEFADSYSEISLAGGLYSNIGKGELIPILDEWLFDDTRKSGDSVLLDGLENGDGYHILYFVKVDEPKWKASARTDISDELYAEFINSRIGNNKIVYVTGEVYDSSSSNNEMNEILNDVLDVD